ncbi:MAG: hypothetical protein L6V93_06690 [Clostridiales bacterium]|nr:MAG: hypothetical protein L6V93_06690 [Clostridiales bacterium]
MERCVGTVRSAVDVLKSEGDYFPIEFEVITAAAFLYFCREKKCDVVVLEVGLGGRPRLHQRCQKSACVRGLLNKF